MDTPIAKRPQIALKPCTSSQLCGFGWDPGSKTLAVQFKPKKGYKTGAEYRYSDVGPDLFEAFQQAESKGVFFREHILRVGFHVEKISDGEPEEE